VSHAPELVDGNRSREILTRMFGTMSFGEVAVDGFFLISGYLITKSYVQTTTMMEFFAKRLLRIVPGYVVCFGICIVAVAPLAGYDISLFSMHHIKHGVLAVLRLLPPDVSGGFHGLPYPALNGAMWTIAYEFRCYIAAALLGAIGLYKPSHRWILLPYVAGLIVLNVTGLLHGRHMIASNTLGAPEYDARLLAVFGVGALYYLYQDRLSFDGLKAAFAGAILIFLMFSQRFAEPAFMILGGYLIFWFALKAPVLPISRLDNKIDPSYGLYLYAWPVQNLIIWNFRDINPWLLCAMTLLLSGMLAYFSWILIEKPSLAFAKRLAPSRLRTSRSAGPLQGDVSTVYRSVPYGSPPTTGKS
jgi:peptidoglycan/LPS O-acetylase OafA/YrhL